MNTQKQTELNGTIARLFIQCLDADGNRGDFLATNSGRQVSPTFDNLTDFYTWIRKSNWKENSEAYVYTPNMASNLNPQASNYSKP